MIDVHVYLAAWSPSTTSAPRYSAQLPADAFDLICAKALGLDRYPNSDVGAVELVENYKGPCFCFHDFTLARS
jgi:hypothetical protein